MKIRVAPRASRDLARAVERYDAELPGLGEALLQEVDRVIAFISRYSEASAAWRFALRPTRRCLLQRFPYGIVYELKTDEVVVLAFSHLRRRPASYQP